MTNQRKILEWLPFLLITVVAAGLRFFHLGVQSIWHDELYTLRALTDMTNGLWVSCGAINNAPPIYFWLTSLTAHLSTDPEWALRFISALAGVLVVPLSGYYVFMLTKSRKTVLFFMILLTLNPLHIWFSQEARQYSLLLFAGSLSLVAWELAIAKRNKIVPWLLYFLATAFVLLIHKNAIAFPIIAWLSLWNRRTILKQVWVPALITSIALSLGTIVMLVWLSRFESISGMDRPFTGLEVGYTFFTYLAGYSFGPAVREIQILGARMAIINSLWQTCIVGLILVALLLLVIRQLRHINISFIWLVIVPVSMTVIFSVASAYPYNVRYTLPALIGFLALISSALVYSGKKGLFMLGVLVSLFVVADIQWFVCDKYGKDDARRAAQTLDMLLPDGGTVAVAPRYADAPLEYYTKQIGSDIRFVRLFPDMAVDVEGVPDALVLTREHHLANAPELIDAYTNLVVDVALRDNIMGYRIFLR